MSGAINNKKVFLKLLQYIKPFSYKLIISLALGLIATICQIISPRFLARIIDVFYLGISNAINGSSINIDSGYIFKIIFFMISICLFGNLMLYLQNIIMANVSVKLTYQLRREMDQKINKLPIKYFDKVTNGEVLSRLTNDVDTMTSMLSRVITQLFTSIITIVGIISVVYFVNWICATVVLIIIIISYVVMKLIVTRSQKFFKSQQDLIGETNGYIEEIYSQHDIVKVFNNEKLSLEIFNKINSKLYNSSWKAAFFSSLLSPIIFFLGNISYMLVIALACILTVNGLISVGDVSSFVSYIKSLNQPVMQLASITSVFQSIFAASQRVFDFLDEKEEIDNETLIKIPEKINGDIIFENVSFSYKKGEEVIKNVSFSVKSGQKIAFVGATGSGKTTLIKLLMRFYELNTGHIYIDGIDITNFSKKDLRSLFSMVLQDAWMFSGSIEDNIKYANQFASNEKLKLATKTAYIDHFIEKLPQKYQTVINDEANNLSQGQKQLITIARAMIADPKILILDEATSSVDIKTEKLIQKAMDNLMNNKTSFIIAHRLSTIKDADVIFVMGHGQILEVGSHDELLQKNGFYTKMYHSQYQFN